VIYLSAFGASFLYVALKATQQLNVMDHLVWRITPVSIGMGLCEVFIIGTISYKTIEGAGFWPMFWLGISLGLGGAVGAILAMNFHRRVR